MTPLLSSLHHRRTPWFTVNFDSATGLANALAASLHGRGFPGVGTIPESEWLARLINALPWKWKKTAYIKGSAKGAVDPERLGGVVAEEFSQWITAKYPQRKYPAILIGSSSGPAVHLGAAMGVPWLPQTFLIPVRTPRHLSVDEPITRMEWARRPARALLDANPDLQLHHMMDPNQDRPMLESTSYFRVKRLTLGRAYERFITENLEEGGTLILVECEKPWPATRVDERYYFQFGGLGGTTIQEYQQGSDDVKDFLQGAGAGVHKWDVPRPDGEMPEAEWGFVSSLRLDAERLAREKGYRIQRVRFNEPEDLSPYTADLYRWWYGQRGLPAEQLLVGTFFLIEPYLTLCTGAVPFWLAFNARPSVAALKDYLQRSPAFERIYLMPFSHGVKGQGLATIEDYKSAFIHARRGGDFIGSEPDLYPFDFGIYARYEKDLKRKLPARIPMDTTLSLAQLDTFNKLHGKAYKVEWQTA